MATEEGRLGRRCLVPPMARGATARVRTIREQTFQVHGPRLFNCLPAYIRNTTKVLEEFKMKLDKFLETMPDEPRMDGLTPGACTDEAAPSNSLLDQTKRVARERRPGL